MRAFRTAGAVVNPLADAFEGKPASSSYAKLTTCSQDTAYRDIDTLMANAILIKDQAADAARAYRLAPIEP